MLDHSPCTQEHAIACAGAFDQGLQTCNTSGKVNVSCKAEAAALPGHISILSSKVTQCRTIVLKYSLMLTSVMLCDMLSYTREINAYES